MKSTGIVRKVDELGRVVIPIELRRTLNITERDTLEIFVEEDRIVLKKYQPNMTCLMTGEISNHNLEIAEGKIVLSKKGAELLKFEIEQFLSDIKN
ncbi:AbrB/MazE/SpoVT family DNA-binding domain-containing protein [Bacillus sp. JJ664]|uniref:Transition state regulator Abh n=1 Tax=Gottfriedia solisilvae TaxID=1516104 RepID=A0A8J3ARJ3_9BACI|nr:AbrB/MazE/SpoVT family DNA-binding domain-containing protein [Gottfriedia solisilvae]GGI18359.1 transition state regulator Abh [Gottfriedia solisilvae]